MDKQSYARYLKSPKWRSLARRARVKAGYRCEKCGKKAKTHVHHKTYDNVGNESLADLMVLCAKCHRKEHGIKSGKEHGIKSGKEHGLGKNGKGRVVRGKTRAIRGKTEPERIPKKSNMEVNASDDSNASNSDSNASVEVRMKKFKSNNNNDGTIPFEYSKFFGMHPEQCPDWYLKWLDEQGWMPEKFPELAETVAIELASRGIALAPSKLRPDRKQS